MTVTGLTILAACGLAQTLPVWQPKQIEVQPKEPAERQERILATVLSAKHKQIDQEVSIFENDENHPIFFNLLDQPYSSGDLQDVRRKLLEQWAHATSVDHWQNESDQIEQVYADSSRKMMAMEERLKDIPPVPLGVSLQHETHREFLTFWGLFWVMILLVAMLLILSRGPLWLKVLRCGGIRYAHQCATHRRYIWYRRAPLFLLIAYGIGAPLYESRCSLSSIELPPRPAELPPVPAGHLDSLVGSPTLKPHQIDRLRDQLLTGGAALQQMGLNPDRPELEDFVDALLNVHLASVNLAFQFDRNTEFLTATARVHDYIDRLGRIERDYFERRTAYFGFRNDVYSLHLVTLCVCLVVQILFSYRESSLLG